MTDLEDTRPDSPVARLSSAEVRLRAYRPGDESEILRLFERCFHVQRSLEQWNWLYRVNPFGGPWIELAVDPNDRIVGHYSGYPVRFHRQFGGGWRDLVASQVGDTMTAPEVRHLGRGPTSLLARLAATFYARRRADRVAFSYGFNTGNIHRFSLRYVGARELEEARQCVLRPARLAESTRASGRSLRLWGARVEVLDPRDRRLDALFERVRHGYRYLVRRDAAYLAWRYGAASGRDYRAFAVTLRGEILGWSVFRREGPRLLWGDALFDPTATGAAARLLDHVLEGELGNDLEQVDGWFSRNPPWWSTQLAELGFHVEAEPQALGFVFVPGLDTDPLPAFRDSLYYTRGDSDLF